MPSEPVTRRKHNSLPLAFAALLLVLFAGLAAATSLAHLLLPSDPPLWVEVLVNAAILTAACVPIAWKFIFRPMQDSLRAEVGKAQSTLDLLFEGVVTIDEEGTIRAFNRAAGALFGYDAHEVLGRNINMLMPSPHREQHASYLARYLRTGERRVIGKISEVNALRKDGSQFAVALSVSELRSANQREFIGIVRDISERRSAEEALRQSSALLERLFSTTHTLFAYLDRDFNFIKVNRAYAQADGRTPAQFAGQNYFALYPDAENAAIFHQVVAGGEAYSAFAKPFAFPERPERGSTYWDWSLHPVLAADGKVDALLLSLVDVTARMQLQAIETLFQQIDQQVLSGEEPGALLQFVCAQVVRLFDFPLTWVGKKEADGSVSVVACAGVGNDCMSVLGRAAVAWNNTPHGRGPSGTAIRNGRTTVFKVDADDGSTFHATARTLGLRAGISIPLALRGEIYGVFTLYARQEHAFDAAATVQTLTGVADRMRIALDIGRDQQQLNLMRTALSAAGNAIFITDSNARIEWVNGAFCRLCGYSEEELLGHNPRLLASGQQGPEYYERLWKKLCAAEVWSGEVTNRRKDGSLYAVFQTITPILGAADKITHFISINEDITDEKQAAERIQKMAYYDALTHLPNRALFVDRLRQVIALAKRNNEALAVLFLDLDHFKKVNDTLGHHVGDLLLHAAATRIKNCVRESDTVARLGGDEFTVMLPQTAQRDGAARVAQKIIDSLSEPFKLEGHEARIGASVGIAFYPGDADESERLIQCADAAMYAAKQASRNTYRFHADSKR